MMTKKHFKAIALILKSYLFEQNDIDVPDKNLFLIEVFAKYFERENQNFNKEKFYNAIIKK